MLSFRRSQCTPYVQFRLKCRNEPSASSQSLLAIYSQCTLPPVMDESGIRTSSKHEDVTAEERQDVCTKSKAFFSTDRPCPHVLVLGWGSRNHARHLDPSPHQNPHGPCPVSRSVVRFSNKGGWGDLFLVDMSTRTSYLYSFGHDSIPSIFLYTPLV